jgi:hypothetical protein
MCRNIRLLFNFEPPVTDDEVRAAALQFVRKVTGFNAPSRANEAAIRRRGRRHRRDLAPPPRRAADERAAAQSRGRGRKARARSAYRFRSS